MEHRDSVYFNFLKLKRNKYVKNNNNRQRAVRRVRGHRSKSGEVREGRGTGMLNADEKTRKDK